MSTVTSKLRALLVLLAAVLVGAGGLVAVSEPPSRVALPGDTTDTTQTPEITEPPPAGTLAPDGTTAPAEIGDPEVGAERGEAIQVSPTLPPPPPTTTPPPQSCPPGSLIRSVDTGGRRLVAFTFDDGPSAANTRPIMSAFESRGLRATFFVIGRNVNNNPALTREIVRRGHHLANHTVTHSYSPSVIAREIGPANRIIESYTGRRTVFFRSPGLTQGAVIQSTLRSLGMCNVFTTVDHRDWTSPRRSASQLCSHFASTLHPGMIVLLHDGGGPRPTTQAVPCMLDVARSRGYQVVTLAELMRSGRPR